MIKMNIAKLLDSPLRFEINMRLQKDYMMEYWGSDSPETKQILKYWYYEKKH